MKNSLFMLLLALFAAATTAFAQPSTQYTPAASGVRYLQPQGRRISPADEHIQYIGRVSWHPSYWQ